ncbi:MAG: hypothetical protein EPO24_13195 [Bacteroidetes bacterium]|nr:MAG: hypothetical protein EPO24_13195 [Bacteroidota bacterium]
MRKLLLLMTLCSLLLAHCSALDAQTRTPKLSFPLWNTGQVLTAGSKTDTSTSNAGLNSLSLRVDKYLDLAAFKHLDNNFSVAQTLNGDLEMIQNTSSDVTVTTYHGTNVSSVTLRRSLGSSSSPSAVTSGSELGRVQFLGRGATQFVNGGSIVLSTATQNWTDVNAGAELKFYTTPNNSTTRTLALTIGQDQKVALAQPLGLSSGGTNANLTASNGGILYSTASALAVLAGTGTANKILLSGSSSAPSWSGATYPSAGGSDNNFLRSDGTNIVSEAVTNDIIKGGSWVSVSAADSFTIFEARENYTVTELRVKRIGGTAAGVIVTRTRSGSQVDLYSTQFTTNAKNINDGFEPFTGGSLQNTSLQAGDVIRIVIRSISGTVSELYIQVTMTETL